MSAAKIINTLWPVVDGNKLTDEQLKRLCCAAGQSHLASREKAEQ